MSFIKLASEHCMTKRNKLPYSDRITLPFVVPHLGCTLQVVNDSTFSCDYTFYDCVMLPILLIQIIHRINICMLPMRTLSSLGPAPSSIISTMRCASSLTGHTIHFELGLQSNQCGPVKPGYCACITSNSHMPCISTQPYL